MASLHDSEPRGKCSPIFAVENCDHELQSTIIKGADVNEQNVDGDTALHLAISRNAEFEILKQLLMHGASVTIKNNDGYTPLQLIIPDSLETFLNLLRLEKYIDYSGGVGNTVMHLMMQVTIDDLQTWETILAECPNLNFNSQNLIGQTPLHIAATRVAGPTDLTFILSNFKNVNVLVADKKGNTFLHTFLANASDNENHIGFLNDLLEGKYQNCRQPSLKRLLQSKNLTGHTPLHLCVNENDIMNEDLLQMFLNAGANMNSVNIFQDDILHGLVRHFPEEVELIACALNHTSNINAQNGFGESPIFFTDELDVLRIFLDLGADLNVKNKVGKTPLMSYLLNATLNPETVKMFLAGGANVNTTDIHGSNILHYAAWNNVDEDIVHLLRESGAAVVRDKLGQLPCHVAEKRGHAKLVNDLCLCDNGVNTHSDNFSFQESLVRIEDFFQNDSVFIQNACIQERIKCFQQTKMSEFLEYPTLGSVAFQEEASDVKTAVSAIIHRICDELGKKDTMLSNYVVQSGSIGENTKVGLPDEFDFVCVLDMFSSICEIDGVKSNEDPGFAYVNLKPEFRREDRFRHLFDQECYLDTEVLRREFLDNLLDIIQNPEICCHGNIVLEFGRFKESQLAPNCQLFLRWTSGEYKDILINVDLVPAIRIKGWWPENTNFGGLVCNVDEVRQEGALLLLQMTFDDDYEQLTKLRISALTAEKAHIAGLPQIARDTYMVSKIVCGDRVCPRVNLSVDPHISYLRTGITSYMLKNCLFCLFQNGNMEAVKAQQSIDKVCSSDLLKEYVCKLFRMFLFYIKEENLPAYVFPWQDVFSFQDFDVDIFPGQNHMKCTCREVYVKVILTILGEVQTFSDIDVKVLTSS